MSEALVIWVFMILIQQQGMLGGMGADELSCKDAQQQALKEVKALGQDILSQSECMKITLSPPR